MSLNDPRALIQIMEDLSGYLERWSRRMSDHIAEADATQRCGQESVERGVSRARGVRERALDDRDRCAASAAEAARVMDAAATAVNDANAADARASRARASAEAAHSRWSANLATAETQLAAAQLAEAQARAARDQAIAALRRAEAQLGAAQDALAQAQSRREYAGKDARGNAVYVPVNLAPYQAAVAAAQAAVQQAQRMLAECEARLTHAIAETLRAQARVHACQQALQCAGQAQAAASVAAGWAVDAVDAAGRAHEDAVRAQRSVEQTAAIAVQQMEHAEEALARSLASHERCDHARGHLLDAERSANSALDLSYGGRQDVRFRVEQLFAFDA